MTYDEAIDHLVSLRPTNGLSDPEFWRRVGIAADVCLTFAARSTFLTDYGDRMGKLAHVEPYSIEVRRAVHNWLSDL